MNMNGGLNLSENKTKNYNNNLLYIQKLWFMH